MTAVQDARSALGERLRELRRHAGLTGRQLAEALSWPASKVSKLENGRQQPTDADIRGWTEATGRGDATEALLASLHTLEEQHAEWQRLLRRGMRAHQDTVIARDARTRKFRAFEPTVVPGLLQTADYARSRFEQGIAEFGVHDVDEAVAARLRRQEMLYRADRRFHLVLTEATLRYSLCPPEVMLGQLDRLIALAALPTVRLGVIGFGTPCTVAPLHGFWLFDDDRVVVESYSAELTLAQPQEIELYARTFDALAGDASYGRAARAIITSVVDDLAAATAPDGD
jgi:transcriptional regulator with XRE-family HTH domain